MSGLLEHADVRRTPPAADRTGRFPKLWQCLREHVDAGQLKAIEDHRSVGMPQHAVD